MLGSTLTLPQSGGDIVLVKVNSGDPYSSEYKFRNSTSMYVAKIRHSNVTKGVDKVKYDRHNLEVTQTIFAASGVAEYERKFYFVFECLPSDTSVALYNAICVLAVASTNALLVSLGGWES
jgi:hypothetical protein